MQFFKIAIKVQKTIYFFMCILISKIFFETKKFHKKKIFEKFELCIKKSKKYDKKLFTSQNRKFYSALECKVLNFLKKFENFSTKLSFSACFRAKL